VPCCGSTPTQLVTRWGLGTGSPHKDRNFGSLPRPAGAHGLLLGVVERARAFDPWPASPPLSSPPGGGEVCLKSKLVLTLLACSLGSAARLPKSVDVDPAMGVRVRSLAWREGRRYARSYSETLDNAMGLASWGPNAAQEGASITPAHGHRARIERDWASLEPKA